MRNLLKALPFVLLLSVSFASAALLDDFQSGLEYVFTLVATNLNFLRLLLAVVIIAVIYQSLLGALGGNKAAAIVVSLVMALIGVRFMPAEVLLRFANFIWIVVLFAVPYFLLGKIFESMWTRLIASAVTVIVFLLLAGDYIGFSFG